MWTHYEEVSHFLSETHLFLYFYSLKRLNEEKNYFPRTSVYEPKRSRPYSFGLGKRARAYDFGLGKKRSSEELDKRLPNRYNFGLGRR